MNYNLPRIKKFTSDIFLIALVGSFLTGTHYLSFKFGGNYDFIRGYSIGKDKGEASFEKAIKTFRKTSRSYDRTLDETELAEELKTKYKKFTEILEKTRIYDPNIKPPSLTEEQRREYKELAEILELSANFLEDHQKETPNDLEIILKELGF